MLFRRVLHCPASSSSIALTTLRSSVSLLSHPSRAATTTTSTTPSDPNSIKAKALNSIRDTRREMSALRAAYRNLTRKLNRRYDAQRVLSQQTISREDIKRAQRRLKISANRCWRTEALIRRLKRRQEKIRRESLRRKEIRRRLRKRPYLLGAPKSPSNPVSSSCSSVAFKIFFRLRGKQDVPYFHSSSIEGLRLFPLSLAERVKLAKVIFETKLTKKERSYYENLAKENRELRKRRRQVVKNMRINSIALFTRENYHTVRKDHRRTKQKTSSTPTNERLAIFKEIARRFREDLSDKDRAELKTRSALLRKCANAEFDAMAKLFRETRRIRLTTTATTPTSKKKKVSKEEKETSLATDDTSTDNNNPFTKNKNVRRSHSAAVGQPLKFRDGHFKDWLYLD
eukprot:PhM_4_TR13298/c0_g1_i2/m.92071